MNVAHEITPTLNLRVSELQFNSEAMRLIVLSLALEAHEAALARGIPSKSVEHQLPFVLGVLDGHFGDLLSTIDVPAPGASDLAGFVFRFSDEAYLRFAQAAKDRVAHAIDGDRDV